MQKILKIFGISAVIIIIILFWTLKRVDYLPYFESDYYNRTKKQLDILSNQLSIAEGKVYLGSGITSITPGIGAIEDNPATGVFKEVPLAGYGSRKGTYAEGVHDSLFVKAVAIKVQDKIMIMIGSDILIIPPNISEGVSKIMNEKLGINRDQLFFTATHTHSGVGAWSEGYVSKEFAGLPNQSVIDWLIVQYSKAIENALKDLKPGKIGSGTFEASKYISNRLIGERGEENPEFVFLLACQDEGKKIVIGSFGAHATTLGGTNMQFSADYPGYWQRKLESTDIDMAVFFAGSVGSHSPQSKGDRFEKSKYIGEALADSVLKYRKHVSLKDSIGLEGMSLKMHLPEFHIRVSDNLRLNPALAKKLLPSMGDVYVQSVRIGDLIWSTAPSDFSGEMAINYQNAMAKEGYKTMVTSFNGAYVGYIIPEKYYHLKEYESRLMSWFGPGMSPYTDEMIRRMMKTLASL